MLRSSTAIRLRSSAERSIRKWPRSASIRPLPASFSTSNSNASLQSSTSSLSDRLRSRRSSLINKELEAVNAVIAKASGSNEPPSFDKNPSSLESQAKILSALAALRTRSQTKHDLDTIPKKTLQTAPVTSLAEVKGKSFKWNVKPNPSIFSQLTGAEKNRSLRNAKKRQGKATAKTFGPMNGVGVAAANNAHRPGTDYDDDRSSLPPNVLPVIPFITSRGDQHKLDNLILPSKTTIVDMLYRRPIKRYTAPPSPEPIPIEAEPSSIPEVTHGAAVEMDLPPHLTLPPVIARPSTSPRPYSRFNNPPPSLALPTVPIPDISTYPSRLSATSVSFTPVPPRDSVPVATLAHGLDRVLFNPGVHWVRDPRSRVYNFPRSLETLPTVDEFDFTKLPPYITSSQDEQLKGLAVEWDKTFVSSTSSTTGMLCQIYFWLSKGKGVNLSKLSGIWQDQTTQFSAGQSLPQSVILNENEGRYSVDADKSMDASIDTNILASLGHLMEKLFTADSAEFSRFLRASDNPIPSQADVKQAYHFTKTEHMILRSQLDATNPYLPNQTFDVKTRGVVAVRQDRLNWEEHGGYLINKLIGKDQSFEKEFFDLYRSAYLKYQFQARIGHMDGIFVAFHNTARVFGFSYVPISDMDEVLFGSVEEGEQAYKLCIGFLEKILIEVKDCYPGESVKATFDTKGDKLLVFVEQVKEREEDSIAPEMILLEVDGSNYVDGVGQYRVDIKLSMEKKAGAIRAAQREAAMLAKIGEESADNLANASADDVPKWEVGYSITKHLGDGVPSQETIFSKFRETRVKQMMFDTLNLPTGVTESQLSAAMARAAAIEDDVVLDPLDLSLRFPKQEGMTYVSKIPAGLKRMRSIARAGRKELDEEESREVARALESGEERSYIVGSTKFVKSTA